MAKVELEAQEQFKALKAELAASRQMNLELRNQLSEANKRITSAMKEYKGSMQFSEEWREACADAFRFTEEETRAKISRVYPELDLSFLEAELFDACTPGAEEAEYEDISDVDLDAILGPNEVAAPDERPQLAAEEPTTFEVGEASQVLLDVTEEAPGTNPNPDS